MSTSHFTANPYNTLSLLTARELRGIREPTITSTGGVCTTRCMGYSRSYGGGMTSTGGARLDRVSLMDLASACAWSPRRLQNMILAVGFDTPASQARGGDGLCASCDTSLGDDLHENHGNASYSSDDSNDRDNDAISSNGDEGSATGSNFHTFRENDTANDGGKSDDIGGSIDRDRRSKREGWLATSTTTTTTTSTSTSTSTSTRDSSLNREEKVGHKDGNHKGKGNDIPVPSNNRRKRSPTSSISSQLSRNTGGLQDSMCAPVSTSPTTGHDHNIRQLGTNDDYLSDSNDSFVQPRMNLLHTSASMSHSGCINTATWLNCPWRLSLTQTGDHTNIDSFVVSSSYSSNATPNPPFKYNTPNRVRAIHSNEYATQILTSGDDRLVKFWDVTNSIGRASPVPCSATTCPFSEDIVPNIDEQQQDSIVKHWTKRHRRGEILPGTVTRLATLNTAHTANVFHATPVPHRPGKIATCAADGCLHLSDVETQSFTIASSAVVSPTVVVGPEHDDGDRRFEAWSLRNMCFSHHFMDGNVGLLCSQKGLQLFDLRLPPSAQSRRNLLGEVGEGCKSCKIFSRSGAAAVEVEGEEDVGVESAYVFAGGSFGDVGLYDLRFVGSGATKVVQTYRPSCFSQGVAISVSGIDLTRDKRELLISYENDQIYTFPILPFVSTAGPSIEELLQYTSPVEQSSKSKREPELAAYGAHLNRLTFLKNAKYAGPSDEYICTGSDSGHAWIYEKATGSVVSLLRADKSTCNGIMPHPQLPIFVTYGIETTAKLWCASVPVSDEVDDSNLGRSNYFKQKKHEMSALAQEWDRCQSKITRLDELNFYESGDHVTTFAPSEIVSRDIDSDDDPYENFLFGPSSTRGDRTSPITVRIGNDLRKLTEVVRDNYFTCANAIASDEEPPVRCGLKELRQRISLIRLHYQCQQLGLCLDPNLPWDLRHSDFIMQHFKKENEQNAFYGKAADLIPDCPSDLICFDPKFADNPQPCGMTFNVKKYEVFFLEQYSKRLTSLGYKAFDVITNIDSVNSVCDKKNLLQKPEKLKKKSISYCNDVEENIEIKSKNGVTHAVSEANEDALISTAVDVAKSWDALHNIILTLKHEGNTVLQAGLANLAAHYYDKAIQYCSLGFMDFPAGSVNFIKVNQKRLDNDGWVSSQWTPLLKTFVSIRLNLSIVMLKAEMRSVQGIEIACAQAKLALSDLKPFTQSKGKVFIATKTKKPREDEPVETYKEAKELQSKAYFRLGSAKLILGLYSGAVKCFNSSIKCTKEADSGAEIEKVVIRRIAEAKRAKDRHKKQQRKRFKGIFSQKDDVSLT